MSTPNYQSIRSWISNLDGTKAAGSLPEKEDDGKPATTGFHAADNKSDLKTVPGADVDDGTKNPVEGNADKPVPDSGLQQATVGKMPDVEKAVKVVSEETAKAAAADLDTEEGMAAALAALEKAAAAMPQLFASAGLNVSQFQHNTPAAQPAPKAAAAPAPAQPRQPTAKEAAEAAAAEVVAGYQKWGSDRGELTARYLVGFQRTYDALVKMASDGEMDKQMVADAGGGGEGPGSAPPPGPDAAAAGPMPAPGGDAPPAGPEGAPGDAAGGQPSLDDVAAALAEMGLTPDDLMQIAQKMQGGVQGDAQASPAEKAAAVRFLDEMQKAATEAKALMRSGKFALKPAADGSERKRRDTAKGYFKELLAASN